MNLNDLADMAYSNAVDKGWWKEERTFGELIALCHSELSEALEEYRNGNDLQTMYFIGDKPEGIPVELADVLIRIFDICGRNGIDLDEAVATKMMYNSTRPIRHGGKVI